MNARQMANHLLARGYGLRNVSTDSWFMDVMVATGVRPHQLSASFEEVRVALAGIEASAKLEPKVWESILCNT